MATLIRAGGWVDASSNLPSIVRKAALPTTTGTCIVVMVDTNSASAVNGDHTGVAKIYVYESNVARTVWTLRATVTTIPTGGYKLPLRYSADLFSDNSVGIAVVGATQIAYVKVTSGAWTVGAWETVLTNSFVTECDITISTDDCAMVAAIRTAASNPMVVGSIHTKATTGGAWVATDSVNLQTTVAQIAFGFDVTVTWNRGGISTARPYVVAWGTIATGADSGVRLYTGVINQTSGALTTALALRKTIAASTVNTSTTYKYPPRRSWLFAVGTNGIRIGVMSAFSSSTYYLYGATWNGTTYAEVYALTSFATPSYKIEYSHGFTANYDNEMLNFYGVYTFQSVNYHLLNWGFKFNATDGSINSRTGKIVTDNLSSVNFWWPSAGGGRNSDNNAREYDILVTRKTSTTSYTMYHIWLRTMPAPASMLPGDGSTVNSSTPNISAEADLDLAWPQSKVRMQWQFATDAGFTTNLKTYLQPVAKDVEVTGTDVAGVTWTFDDILPSLYQLSQGVWFGRVAHIDDYDNLSAYTSAVSFTVSHPPSAFDFAPAGDSVLLYGTGNVLLRWSFSDPWSEDTQTAFAVSVKRVSDDVSIASSGKVTSTAKSYSIAIPAGEKDKLLYWEITTYDIDDVASVAPVGISTFMVIDPPSVVFNSPTDGATLTSGMLNVQFTPTVSAIRTIDRYRVIVSQAASVVYDTGYLTTGGIVTGTLVTYQPNVLTFKNNQTYSITVIVTDSGGLEASSTINVSTSWTPPAQGAGLALTVTPYNVEGQGYVQVDWNDTARDADFRSYVIYRKDDELDPNTGSILTAGVFTPIIEVFTPSATYQFFDYFAPSGYKCTYYIAQRVDRFGELVESETTTSSNVSPKSDGYWLIGASSLGAIVAAIKMSIVTSDSYDDEYEESEFTIVGRGRHIERGEHLGYSGNLGLQIRDSVGFSARMKKRNLENMKESTPLVYLRTPFGDNFYVNVGNIGVSRIAGVGLSEFCDVTVPYKEVGK